MDDDNVIWRGGDRWLDTFYGYENGSRMWRRQRGPSTVLNNSYVFGVVYSHTCHNVYEYSICMPPRGMMLFILNDKKWLLNYLWQRESARRSRGDRVFVKAEVSVAI